MVNKKTIITVGSIFLVGILAVSIFLPLYYNTTNTKKEINKKEVNVRNFFSEKSIGEDGRQFKIINQITRDEILNKLTNYNEIYSCELLLFDENLIKHNLLNILKDIIIKKQTYINDLHLFVQLRYRLYSEYSLFIDVRWTDCSNYSYLFYDRYRIDLNIV